MLSCIVAVAFEGISEVGHVVGFLQLIVVPGTTKIIFCACAVQGGRPFFPIDEEHVVSLTPPAGLICIYMEKTAHVMSLALCIQQNVVILAIGVETLDLACSVGS